MMRLRPACFLPRAAVARPVSDWPAWLSLPGRQRTFRFRAAEVPFLQFGQNDGEWQLPTHFGHAGPSPDMGPPRRAALNGVV